MQFRQLRRMLQHIVLAGLPAAAGGCVEAVIDDDCVDTVARGYEYRTPVADPSLQLAINSCRVDADACNALCEKAMRDHQLFQSPTKCEVRFDGDAVGVNVSYEIYTNGEGCAVEGRRPAGLAAPGAAPARTATGAWLAHAAWLEGASIHAFVRLARELAEHGAPAALQRWALLAAREEVRHAQLLSAHAARYGALAPVPVVAPPAARSLEEIAVENAAEGCVRETWGAAVAEWQARTARDPALRAAFAEIARDEARHAALAWAVDRWARTRLDEAARARVDAARAAAARELLETGEAFASAALGLPDTAALRGLAARAHHAFWTSSTIHGGRTCHA